ncbi:MAG: lipid A biosynthesis acyltransferase, partial [Muriicola sp.]
MQLLVYIIAYPLLRLISVLPNFLFYGFSNVLFFLLFYIIGYRRAVVQKNLQLTFPNSSQEERS